MGHCIDLRGETGVPGANSAPPILAARLVSPARFPHRWPHTAIVPVKLTKAGRALVKRSPDPVAAMLRRVRSRIDQRHVLRERDPGDSLRALRH
jgi:hypothetical protein